MPSVKELQKEAMDKAKAHIAEIAKKGYSAAFVVKQIENELLGVTVEFSTSRKLFASSHQQPTLEIVGTLGTINTTVEALPLITGRLERQPSLTKKRRRIASTCSRPRETHSSPR